MTNPLTSVVHPEISEDNKMTINSFMKQSYDQAKKQAEDCVSYIQDRVLIINEGFSVFYYETGQCINKMALPVNNFLKDISQIESELLKEISTVSPHYLLMNGEMIPVEKVLTMPMEENH